MSRVDQKEIARRCRVSRAAVWAALGGNGATVRVSEETRRRIVEEAERAGYRPHAAARALRAGRSRTLVFAQLSFGSPSAHVPHATQNAMAAAVAQRRYATELLARETPDEVSRDLETAVHERRCGGVFLRGDALPFWESSLAVLREHRIAVCAVECAPTPGITTVAFDYRSGACAAVEHLFDCGRRHIAFVGPAENHYWCRERLKGYLLAHQRAGLRADRRLQILLPHVPGGTCAGLRTGRNPLARLLSSGPAVDGLFAAFDELAIWCVRTVIKSGRAIPDDTAVVGFDDDPIGEAVVPSLTTVRQDPERLGRLAVDLLVDQIEGAREGGGHHVVPTRLVVRESTRGNCPTAGQAT